MQKGHDFVRGPGYIMSEGLALPLSPKELTLLGPTHAELRCLPLLIKGVTFNFGSTLLFWSPGWEKPPFRE
eukprot:1144682-Pelagomonas_calceolata.AAC.6